MSRSINYNTLKGNVEDLEEFLTEKEIEIPKVEKIKRKKKFDDGTLQHKEILKKIKSRERDINK